MSFLARAMIGLVGFSAFLSAQADQWVGPPVTPTAAQAGNDGGSYGIYVTTAQAVVNPADCPSTGGYVTTDPQLTNQVLAIVLSAIATGTPIQIYVSSSQMAVGYSASSTSVYPSVRYTGRLATDPVGTLQSENSIVAGAGSQTSYSRWGDYTSISVDPVDDCTFWYTDQHLKTTGNFNWSTRVASFKFPNCIKKINIVPIISLLLLH